MNTPIRLDTFETNGLKLFGELKIPLLSSLFKTIEATEESPEATTEDLRFLHENFLERTVEESCFDINLAQVPVIEGSEGE